VSTQHPLATVKCKLYLVNEWIYALRCNGFDQDSEEENTDLELWQRSRFLGLVPFVSIGEQRSLFVASGMSARDGHTKARKFGGKEVKS
jgi:hypothetical protein